MGGAKRVVDIDVRERGERLGKIRIVLGFFLIEAHIFDDHDLARLEGVSHRMGFVADDVGGELHFAAHQLAQALRDRRESALFLGFLILRTAQVGAEDHPRTVVREVFDRGDGLADTLVIGDDAVGQRDVEIAAHEHFLPVYVDVLNGLFVPIIHGSLSSFRCHVIFMRSVVPAGAGRFPAFLPAAFCRPDPVCR